MTTPPARILVSLAATLALTLGAGACARQTAPNAHQAAATASLPPLTVRFENEAQVHVDVYLIGDRREWRLGRVAPGARTTLALPTESFEEGVGFVRLAVLADVGPAVLVARDPRATFAIAQPAGSLLTQRWTFSQRPLSAPLLSGALLPRIRR